MKIELTDVEARIIGSLIEKEVATPDHYPLSLNALVNACNQKSSREPVMSLVEVEVKQATDKLIEQRMVSDDSQFNSRVSKYQHRFCNTEFGDLRLTVQEKALVCCLLLRGAQTPGELRTRTNRLAEFENVKEVEQILAAMMTPEKGAWVVQLPKEAGKRDFRYMHQFCGEVDISALSTTSPTSSITDLKNKVLELEQENSDLKAYIVDLEQQVSQLNN